nr:reverse transcriptase domain-containing protein [Tanacetum cinerariifolium]
MTEHGFHNYIQLCSFSHFTCNHAYQEDVVIAIQKLVVDKVARALAADRVARNDPNVAEGSGGNGVAQLIWECSFDGFMKCGPTQFHGHEGAVELCRWFEKTESVFDISECAERSKIRVCLLSGYRIKRMD